MGEIKAGVVVVTEFCSPESNTFQNYIDYIDRDEAVRTEYSSKYNLYADYMGNPEKTSGLFTSQKDSLSKDEKAQLKEGMKAAQENGSLMWQTVISFDNRWLQQNGIYDRDGQILDEGKLREVTRNAVGKMLKNEGLENALWSAAIHYNTDNIHIHVATVEPVPMRQKKEYIQYREAEKEGRTVKEPVLDPAGNPAKKAEYVGRFKLKSIEQCKSAVVNQILQQQQENLKINQIIRKSIIDQKKQNPLSSDKELSQQFLRVYRNLPDCDRKMWNYNTNIMNGVRPQIDELSRRYIETYHKEEYEELTDSLKIQSLKYQQAYGLANDPEGYMEGKMKDLYTRLGNSILKEMRAYDKEMRREFGRGREPEEPVDRKEDSAEDFMEEQAELPPKKNTAPRYGERGREGRRKELDWSDGYREARSLIYKKPKDYRKALEILCKEPENALALYEIGNIYQYGRGVKIDKEKANEYYGQALKLFEKVYTQLTDSKEDKFYRSYVPYRIAKQYFYGQGTGKDYALALRYYQEAAAEGNKYAVYSLGNMYYAGQGVETDYQKALRYFEEAADSGNAYASYKAGKMYEEGLGCERDKERADGFYQKAYKGFLEMLGKDSDDNLEYRIAMMELHGVGTEVNRESAVSHLENAAEAKNPYALYQLAKIKMEDQNIESLREAEGLLKEAATEGKMDIAQYALGKLYTDQENPLYNLEEGMRFLEMAFGQGNKQAGYRIGKLYADPGLEIYDLEKAVHYLDDPQMEENIYAQCLLGKCLLKLPQESQRQRGVKVLEAASRKGSLPASYALGRYLACESENLEDVPEGIAILQSLAEKDHEYAQVSLGIFYLKGERGERNIGLAKYWLARAGENGNEIAGEILANIEQREAAGRTFHGRNRSTGFFLGKSLRSLKKSMENEWKKQRKREMQRNEQEHDRLAAGGSSPDDMER